ncbi:hypothetical protein SVAN01_00790 [Stagonosporopsis vannaccii]|nr:hypothetical protein SVAN01_00790 [Stagonosporopsis vannaccii]
MSWTLLPNHLQISILQHYLASPETIDHDLHLDNLVCGDLEILISTGDSELVGLAVEAYYSSNVFVVKAETGLSEGKVFRPRVKHALLMLQLVDETQMPKSAVEKAIAKRKDSGVGHQDETKPDNATFREAGAPKNDAASAQKPPAGTAVARGKKTPSHGRYLESHKAKLERTMRLVRALEEKPVELA